ncbi:MAG: rod shape-determining protein MreC [Acidimicrobiia bacterium]|nr:rod shape-determining protein MreC [Acidimicrobiia bacterium]
MLPYGESRRGTVTMGVLVLISFLLMTFDIRSSPGGLTETVRDGVQTIFNPFQQAAQMVIDPVVDGLDALANLASLREENVRLREEREELLSQMAEAQAALVENVQLRALLKLQDQFPDYTLTTAAIISSGDTFDLRFTINRGADDGIVAGSVVVDEAGALIGFVVEVGAANATVAPIIATGVVVKVATETGMRGFISGQGTEDRVRLEIYDATDPVPANSVLRTFQNDNNTPNGLNVAIVSELATINVSKIDTNEVVPFFDFTRLQFVTVLGVSSDLIDEPIDEPTDSTVPGESDTTDSSASGDDS